MSNYLNWSEADLDLKPRFNLIDTNFDQNPNDHHTEDVRDGSPALDRGTPRSPFVILSSKIKHF